MKDEPISPEKNEMQNCRVFNCVPFSFNWVAKMYLSPMEAYIRCYPHIFESYVGINMSSSEADALIKRFLNFAAERGLDVDMKKQDKSMLGELVHYCALAVYAIATHIGLPAEECYLLLEGARNSYHVMRGQDFCVFGGTVTTELS